MAQGWGVEPDDSDFWTPRPRAPAALSAGTLLPFAVFTIAINLFLAQLGAGSKLLFLGRRQAFIAAPCIAMAYMVIGWRAADNMCSSLMPGGGSGGEGALLKLAPNGVKPVSDFMAFVPSALFTCLVLQGTMQYFISQLGARAKFGFMVLPCIGVHAITLLYYMQEQLVAPCTLVTWYGLELRPFHYFLWINSISLQAFTLAGLSLEVAVQARAGRGRAQLTAREQSSLAYDSARYCALAMAATQAMCWAGALSEALQTGAPWVNRCLMAICFVSFYTLLYAIARPLDICIESMGAAAPVNAERFRAIKRYVCVGYHAFPLAWALGYVGMLEGRGMRLLLMCCDTIAKFLPISLYISTMTSE